MALIAAQLLGDPFATDDELACRVLGVDAIERRHGPTARAAVEAHASRATSESAERHLGVLAIYGVEISPDDRFDC